MNKNLLFIFLLYSFGSYAQQNIQESITAITPQVIKWRRDFHQYPELSNREFKTAKKIAKYLQSLGLKVTTNIAHTGVVGILEGGQPGKVVALRADMDALPITETTTLSFKSTEKTTFLDQEVGISHACGHDTHMAILMGTATVLSKHKDQLKGTVKFIFQPAEEGAPPGEEGGAKLMIKEGVLQNPDVDAIFGLHISASTPVGMVRYASGSTMAAVERFVINVQGKQTHGASPWAGVDPILISAKIIDGLQTIISREMPLIQEAAVITIGKINSGIRFNIIPNTAEMIGTVRTLDPEMKTLLLTRMRAMVPAIAKAYGGTASIAFENKTAITYNDPKLVQQMLPTLHHVAGLNNVILSKATTGGEDFSFFQEKIPGFYFFIGGKSPTIENPNAHHTSNFDIDEDGMALGVSILSNLAIDYLQKEFQSIPSGTTHNHIKDN